MDYIDIDRDRRNTKKNTKIIKIELSEKDYDLVAKQAEQMKLPIRRYAKMRVLDQVTGPDMRCRQIMQLMPHFYLATDKVTDSEVQQELREIGGRICRFIK